MNIRSLTFAFIVAAGFFSGFPLAHAETKVQILHTKGGIEAWLVQNANLPIIAVEFAFMGGAAQDPKGKEGLAHFTAGMFDEGAGPLDARAFQQKLQRLAVSLRFNPSEDYLAGAMQTLSANRQEAFELLRLSLAEPRFEQDAVERVRGQATAMLRRQANDPDRRAYLAFSAAAFPDHPYGKPIEGTEETVRTIRREDIVAAHKRLLARDNLKITVAGDIDAVELEALLDKTFGGLPEKADLKPVEDVELQSRGRRIVVDLKSSQSRIQFGAIGPKRHDPDFMAVSILSSILGGDSLTTRLFDAIREKRGLAYGVNTSLLWYRHAGIFMGLLSSRNEMAAEALKVAEQEISKFAQEGPSAKELEDAKNFLVGTYALRFDTTAKIAGLLLGLRVDDLDPSYLTEREKLICAVTIDDVRKAAQKYLKDPLLVVVAGEPKDVKSQ